MKFYVELARVYELYSTIVLLYGRPAAARREYLGEQNFLRRGEKFFGKIGLKELYTYSVPMFTLPSRFLKSVLKGKSSKVLYNLTERLDSV